MNALTWLFEAIDTGGDANAPLIVGMQKQLMDQFFQDISLRGMIHFTFNNAEMDYCGAWPGITCKNRKVRKIEYEGLRFGNFRLETVPPSTSVLKVVDCKQNYELRIRAFPRAAENVELQMNKLYGRLDFCHLPNALFTLNLSVNRLTGPLMLQNLPPHIKSIFLYGNHIKQEVVFYGKLPDSLTLISLPRTQGRHCGISRVCAIDPSCIVSKDRFDFPADRID